MHGLARGNNLSNPFFNGLNQVHLVLFRVLVIASLFLFWLRGWLHFGTRVHYLVEGEEVLGTLAEDHGRRLLNCCLLLRLLEFESTTYH